MASQLTLPVHGMTNAAGTTTTLPSASAEVSQNAAMPNGMSAADSSTIDYLFEGDFDFNSDSDSLFGVDDGAESSTNHFTTASGTPEAPNNVVLPSIEGVAGVSTCQDLAPPIEDDNDRFDIDWTGGATWAASASPFVTPERAAEPLTQQHSSAVAAADGSGPAPAPANGAPAKRGRGRPPGKQPPKAPVKYRCRYGCKEKAGKVEVPQTFDSGVYLRKHMMRVHCIFSSAHQTTECSLCGRTIDPKVKELNCNKTLCKPPTPTQKLEIGVIAPRDAQEEADTFAYANSGPNGEGPSPLVIVKPGDNPWECARLCREAIENWRPAAAFGNHVLPTPGNLPVRVPAQFVDLTGEAEDVPAMPFPWYQGMGQHMVAPVPDLISDTESISASPTPHYEGKGKKRSADHTEGPHWEERTPKRAMGNVPAGLQQTGSENVAADDFGVADLLTMSPEELVRDLPEDWLTEPIEEGFDEGYATFVDSMML